MRIYAPICVLRQSEIQQKDIFSLLHTLPFHNQCRILELGNKSRLIAQRQVVYCLPFA